MEKPSPTPKYAAIITQRQHALAELLGQQLPARGEVVWELGCGHGHFLTAYAQQHPARICVGIDQDSDRIRRATRKRDRARLGNLHFIQAEARLFLQTLPSGIRFSDVYVLFPDPWPKLRHHKHRILQPEFLTRLTPRMAPRARLFFRTDHADYFADAQKTVRAHPAWEMTDDGWKFEYATVFQQRAGSYHSFTAQTRRNA